MLLSTFLALGSCAERLAAQPAEIRVATLRVAAEEMYRAQPNWEATLRRTVKTVSDIYEKSFQIRLVVHDVVPWTVGPSVPIRSFLGRLRGEVPIGSADVLVGFAAERCEKLEYGVAQVFDRFALVQTACLDTAVLSNTTPEALLSHEMAHLFGAFHPAIGADSVMRGGPADRFDSQAIRVIKLMRNFDFSRGVLGLDQETRRTWSAIYAEGHARNEPNPRAGAIAAAGWRVAESGQHVEGEALLREALAIAPSAARTHTILGYFFIKQGRLEDAVGELKIATRLDFREVEARTELGFVLLRLGREDEALVELRDVLRIDYRAPRAYLGLGMVLARRGRHPEAISAFNSAIKLDPKNGPAYLQLANALDRSGRRPEALAAAEQAQRLGQTLPPGLSQRLSEKEVASNKPAAEAAFTPACSGDQVSLDTPEPRYQDYLDRIRERIKARWIYPRSAGERGIDGELLLEFSIAKDGRVDCMMLHRSSGVDALDQAAVDAVRAAQPFPPVPDPIARQTLSLHGTFRYQLVGGWTAPRARPAPESGPPAR